MKNNNKKIKNVFLGHTLEEYKAIYDIDKTIHIDKHAVDEFNKKHRKATKDSPLEGRLWWLIDDVYYEVESINPKVNNKHKKNKGHGFKIAMAGILGGVCGLGVLGGGGYLMYRAMQQSDPEPVPPGPEPEPEREIEITGDAKEQVNFTPEFTQSGSLKITFACKDITKEVSSLTAVKVGNKSLVESEYNFNVSTQILEISKSILDENKGNISINPTITTKVIHVTSINCKDTFNSKIGETITFGSLNVTVVPDNATNKNYTITTDNDNVFVDNTNKTIRCDKVGTSVLTIRSDDNPNITHNCTITIANKIFIITPPTDVEESLIKNYDFNSSYTLKTTFEGSEVTPTSWSCNNNNVSVTNGTITINDKTVGGSATITAKYTDENGIEFTANYDIEIASYNGLQVETETEGTYFVHKKDSSLNGKIYLPVRYYLNGSFVNVSKIGENSGQCDSYGFYGTSINSITIPENSTPLAKHITKIGEHTFAKCNSLTTVKLNSDIGEIGMAAFSCMDSSTAQGSLTEINLKDLNYLYTIGVDAFRGQKELTSIHIPQSVTSIGNYCFYGCAKLSIVKIDSSTIAKSYPTGSNLVDNVTTLYITKNVEKGEIDTNLTIGLNEGSHTDDYWVFTK